MVTRTAAASSGRERTGLDKAADAFRTISEVAEDLDVPQHVLRFWESRFSHIRPMKRAGGRRYYRPDDVDLLRGIRQLLYGEGYTIRGVQRILKEHGIKFVQTVWQEGAAPPPRLPDDEMAEEGAEPEAGEMLDLRLPASQAGEVNRMEPTFGGGAAARDASGAPGSASAGGSGSSLRSDDLQNLQAALQELQECRRLLDGVLR
jgi:DNA-binding transcriptional MerR regulator